MSATYTASNIRVLTPAETADRFGWVKAAALAEQYRKPETWIARGLEACRRARVDPDYFERRYLQRLNIPRDERVDAAMRELATERRRS